MEDLSKELVRKNKDYSQEHKRLRSINEELEKWKKLTIARELKMAELKKNSKNISSN